MRPLAGLGTAAVLVAVLFGCKGEDDELAPAVKPRTFTFEGKPDARFAGTWQSKDGRSTLDMTKEGGLKIATAVQSQQGKNVSTVEGDWGVSGDRLSMRYAEKSGENTVLKYVAKLDGNTLELTPDGGKIKTVYSRK